MSVIDWTLVVLLLQLVGLVWMSLTIRRLRVTTRRLLKTTRYLRNSGYYYSSLSTVLEGDLVMDKEGRLQDDSPLT